MGELNDHGQFHMFMVYVKFVNVNKIKIKIKLNFVFFFNDFYFVINLVLNLRKRNAARFHTVIVLKK